MEAVLNIATLAGVAALSIPLAVALNWIAVRVLLRAVNMRNGNKLPGRGA